MIERIFKNIKFISLGFILVDVLFAILTIIYFSLTLTGVMSVELWFVIVCIIVIALNIAFITGLLVIKKLRRY